jgi:hypothetical protein
VLAPDVTAFVRAALPATPARLLEVGAGSGELADVLSRGGYDVVAIDPASQSPAVRSVALHELEEPAASFHAAIAVVSLHHVEPLPESCRKLGELVRSGGTLVVDEFDVERFDERAASWWLAQRRAAGSMRYGAHASWSLICAITSIRCTACPWRSTNGSSSGRPRARPICTAGICRRACATLRTNLSDQAGCLPRAHDWSAHAGSANAARAGLSGGERVRRCTPAPGDHAPSSQASLADRARGPHGTNLSSARCAPRAQAPPLL